MSLTSVNNHAGINEVPGYAWNNNTTTPITNDDKGKPVKVNSATGLDVILCSDGDEILGFVGAVDPTGDVVTVIQDGFQEATATEDSTAPVIGAWAVAAADGKVKTSATITRWFVTYVNGSDCTLVR